MKSIAARCLMCGKTFDVAEDHKDYSKLEKKKDQPTFICDMCGYKIRYEADEEQKPKKPM